MTIDEIFEHWDKDSKIDKTELGKEAIAIPALHNKYYRFYVNEKLRLIKLEADIKQLQALRYDFYSGAIDDDTLKEHGWLEDFANLGRRSIIKSEIPRYLDADKILSDNKLILSMQSEKVALLDSIIKTFVGRGFNIKSGIEWARFQVGA